MHPRMIAYILSKRRYGLEWFCPAEFHHISGDDVCLRFCRKTVCSVYKNLQKANPVLL